MAGFGSFFVPAQVAVVATAMGGAALWPPASGAMLLVPISGRQTDAANAALDAGARLVVPGPIAGSLFVAGERHRLARHRVILLAAPDASCGAIASSEGK